MDGDDTGVFTGAAVGIDSGEGEAGEMAGAVDLGF